MRELTDSEIAEIYEKQCKKCMYSGSAGGMKCCDYFLITGMRRNCSPVNCKRFDPGTREKLIKPNFDFPGSLPKLQTKPKVAAVHREHNLTQTEFARQCGIQAGIINKWRRGKGNPARKNLEKACAIMGIDIEVAMNVIAKGAVDAEESANRVPEEGEKEAEKEAREEHNPET